MSHYISVKVIEIDQHLTELHSHPSMYHSHGVVFLLFVSDDNAY